MNVLSLFNGISAFHLALDRAGIETNTCYYAEIDKYANKITEQHYPDDVALGDVTKWRDWDIDWSSIDLVGAGFPCQAWSVAGKQLGDKDERGALFWTTLDIIANVLKHNPKAKFLMENVKMKKDFEQYITHHTEQALGKVEKTLINSALVSAQNRQRYYWTNFEVSQPEDKGILLKDVLERNVDSSFDLSEKANHRANNNPRSRAFKESQYKAGTLMANQYKQSTDALYAISGGAIRGRYIVDGKRQDHKMKTAGLTEQRLEVRNDEKTNTLTTVQKDNVVVFKDKSQTLLATIYKENAKSMVKRNKLGLCVSDINKTEYVEKGIHYRKLTPLECERLQTFCDGWTDCLSNTQRYKSLGNAWTVDVIAHIFKEMNKCETV